MATVSVSKDFAILNTGKELTLASVGAGDTFQLAFGGADYKTAILVVNGAAASTITIPAGNGFAGAAEDLVYEVAANKTAVIVVDSGYYKKVSGELAGKIVGTASKACSMAVIELP